LRQVESVDETLLGNDSQVFLKVRYDDDLVPDEFIICNGNGLTKEEGAANR